MAISFSKLKSGQWGLRGTGIKIGIENIVAKRDGSTTIVIASAILWTGQDGTQIASIGSATAPVLRQRGDYDQHGYCDECGERPTPGTRCWETGAAH